LAKDMPRFHENEQSTIREEIDIFNAKKERKIQIYKKIKREFSRHVEIYLNCKVLFERELF
jgi:hypothetical protein